MIHKAAIVTLILLIFKETNSLDAPISGAFSYENDVVLENHVAHLVLDIKLDKLEGSVHILEKSLREFNATKERIKASLPEVELINFILNSEVENIRSDFNDIKSFFTVLDNPPNDLSQDSTERPALVNSNDSQQQEQTIIVKNVINPSDDNTSNTNQTLRKKRTTTTDPELLDQIIQNTPISDNQDTEESDTETNTEMTYFVTEMTGVLTDESPNSESEHTHEIPDTIIDYNDNTETPDVQNNPRRITTEATIHKTITPETDTESYMTGTEIVTNDQNTNEKTTIEPDTNEKTTDEFKTNTQTTHRPIDNTTNLKLTTTSELPLTLFLERSGITFPGEGGSI